MGTEIYYFSGTGNSLFVARELQKKVPDSVIIPIVSLLHKDVIQTNGKTIGIVFPCHALTIPIAVKRFIRKIDVQSAMLSKLKVHFLKKTQILLLKVHLTR